MDDLTGKINDLLSDPESMEKIKNLASMFSGSSGGGNSNEEHEEHEQPKKQEGGDDLPIDPAMLMKITQAMKLMKRDDPRIDLLLALRQNLSEPRRKKIDEAIHILRLLSLMPLLREQGFLNL